MAHKTVLITGCSSGFGEATAKRFAADGWNVAATMRTLKLDGDLGKLDRVHVTRLDVQDRASIETAVAETIARFGGIDVVVNNAGFGLWGIFEAMPPEKLREQFDVNVFGVMDVTRAVLPHFRERKAGVVVNISSGAGVFTLPMISAYCASKFALEGFSEALSYELASQNVIVKIVEPGGVTSTNFGPRSAAEAAGQKRIADYDRFVEGASAVFDGMRAARGLATSEEVADVVFRAATDGSTKLRYVATEDIKPLVSARRETSEDAYISMMRDRFMPKS